MKRWHILLLIPYQITLGVLLLAELGVGGFNRIRATNQVLLLVALLFLPFVVVALTSIVHSVTVKLPGKDVWVQLGQLREDVERVEGDASARLSNAEQALYPILAGDDLNADSRLASRHLVIGSKLDLSQAFLAHLLAEWIEDNLSGVQCEPRVPNGGSLKNYADLKHKRIDLYVDYTGTCCQLFNVNHRGKTTDDIINQLDSYSLAHGVKMLRPLGATEDYRLVMKVDRAKQFGVKTIADLRSVSKQLTLTADPEFLNRWDCYLGLLVTYGLRFARTEPCKVTDRYAFLSNGRADVFVGYETDPELRTAELLPLDDSEGFFPRYHALPLVRVEALQRIPGLQDTLLRLEDVMTTEDLTDYVLKLRNRGGDAAVARDLAKGFLKHSGLPPVFKS